MTSGKYLEFLRLSNHNTVPTRMCVWLWRQFGNERLGSCNAVNFKIFLKSIYVLFEAANKIYLSRVDYRVLQTQACYFVYVKILRWL